MDKEININERQRIKQILECLRIGDHRSSMTGYAYFVKTYSRQVLDFTSRMVADKKDAEELSQDAFVKAYRSLPSFRFQSSFITWVCRIAYHESLNHLRRQKQHWVDIEEAQLAEREPTDEEFSTGREDRIKLMEEAIGDLPPDEQMLIHLYYYKDKPLREIAFIMDANPNALATRLHRIRKKLLTTINSKEDETSRR